MDTEICKKLEQKLKQELNIEYRNLLFYDEPDHTIHHNGTSSKTTKDEMIVPVIAIECNQQNK